MLSTFDFNTNAGRTDFDQLLQRLQQTVSLDSAEAAAVAQIIADVRRDGDDAVVQYMQRWTDPQFDVDCIAVTPRQCAVALDDLNSTLRQAIEAAIEHVRAYQHHVLPSDPPSTVIDGCTLGMRHTPVDSAGLMVPGGTAVLFSTLVMLAVPALVAGVDPDRIAVVHPPPTRRGSEPFKDHGGPVLAMCALLGLRHVYRLGGAQAVAALAFGTPRVPRVDMVAGPGNIYVQLAKAQLHGIVGTDSGFYGPSEVAVVVDASADPRFVAADLLAQAEHDPGKCFLVAWSRQVVDEIFACMRNQLEQRARRDAIRRALAEASFAVLVNGAEQAVEVVNRIAAEHVSLAVEDAEMMAAAVRHAGEIFMGDATPVAAGDYFAGPSHCLPTGRTSRFASGISVNTFLKRTGMVRYGKGMDAKTVEAIATLAEAEGLDGHAASARLRQLPGA